MFARIPSAAYMEFKAWLLEEQKQSPDGTSVAWRAEVRAELYNPQDLTNQAALPSAIGVMQAWCAAISNACGKTAVKNYLVGGEFGLENQTETMRDALTGAHRNNDALAESVFGLTKHLVHITGGLPPHIAAGQASARKQDIFQPRDLQGPGKLGKRRGRGAAEAAAVTTASPFSVFRYSPEAIEVILSMIRSDFRSRINSNLPRFISPHPCLFAERSESTSCRLTSTSS